MNKEERENPEIKGRIIKEWKNIKGVNNRRKRKAQKEKEE